MWNKWKTSLEWKKTEPSHNHSKSETKEREKKRELERENEGEERNDWGNRQQAVMMVPLMGTYYM